MKTRALLVSAIALLVVVACAVAFIWWIARCNRCGELLQKATAARARNDMPAAEALYNAAITSVGSYFQKALAYGGRAAIELGRRHDDNAVTDYTIALAADNSVTGLYTGRAIAWQHKGEYNRALQDYEAALHQNPNDAFVFNNRCEIFIARKDWPKALPDLNDAIRCQPEFAAAYASRGAIFDQLMDYDHALNDYDVAVRLNPLVSSAYRGRSGIYRLRGQRLRADADEMAAGACSDLGVSALSRPGGKAFPLNAAVALYHAADAAQKAGAHQQAIVLYTVALFSPELDGKTELGGNARAYCQLERAIAEMVLDDFAAAKIDLDASIALNPTFDGAYIDRANIALRFGRFDDVIADCDAAIKLNPRRAEAFINRADAFAGKNEARAAQHDFATAAELNPNLSELYLHRAVFLLVQHSPAEALADTERALQLKPDSAFALSVNGHALSALGRFSEADAAYNRVLALRRESTAGVLNGIAWFYATCPDAKFRRPAEAIALGCRACDLTYWRSSALRDTLAAAYAAAGDFRPAVENERSAIAIGSSDPANRTKMAQHLTLYEQQQPYLATNY